LPAARRRGCRSRTRRSSCARLSPLEKVVYCPESRRRLSMTRPPDSSGLERFSLSGRIVLITGATRGLGLEIARGMAAAGAVVGINGRDAAQVGAIAAAIPDAFPAPFDITDLDAAAAVIDAVVARHGRLDCPVN